ncbi:MAG: tyrosine--tRNA ligase [Candidatus Komeilibacteria bacterium CG_4_10_14_0_2_um_filter_37_10]|uniref:Tyrosine--tRNA ligase n=1 Tax=Candidatus Komeilibacteria bacterium CG_4_10_14_0_2_um_filter_37_10 TaxID=1974470 RepID=A0A2M7VDL0_9BACT|nr:MAG: tyrosine--tRNA ligase [Candidatus Komeilibacteria bacterium CG_4_10_14_0_2_um_filter_37_10]PJA94151.1 MAG: tyrosine--tRNA ligase [Candidatus Komeilibacteria bacterium CG_4_9_14_3_um_filter_37_5]
MKVNNDKKAVAAVLSRGVAEVVVEKDLRKKLLSGQKLRIKHGIDPTSKDLHLGYAVVYEKLRQLQKMGHQIIFLIGSFTGRFGDPTDKGKARDLRRKEDVMAMAKNYIKQLSKILDIDQVEIRYNSEWYDRFSAEDLLRLMSKFTVARMLERDMFQKRIQEEREIFFHEPVYPMLQGYDSVMLKSDLTVIGLDQKFNELQARPLQEQAKQTPQDLIMVPLLIGTDGKQKMSQSLGNYIGITDSPQEQYGKTMSIPDQLIYMYFELCTRISNNELAEIEQMLKNNVNPRNLKAQLAHEIVSIYHGNKAADKAEAEFTKIFKDKGKPTNIPMANFQINQSLLDIMVGAELTSSKSEAQRMIEQKAVHINDVLVTSWRDYRPQSKDIIQVGKRKFVQLK